MRTHQARWVLFYYGFFLPRRNPKTKTVINNIESNKIPELKQIVNLCDVLGLSMDKLFDIALPKSKNTQNDYFTQREEAKRHLNLEDSENLNVITERIYSLNSAQLKVIREIIDLWK